MPPKQSKTAPSEDDSVVTMSVLSQLMDQQREFYREMLHQQQDNFKSFVQLVVDGTNKRLDGVIRDVQDIKTSLEFTQHKVDGLMTGYKDVEIKIKQFEKDIVKSKEELDGFFVKLDYVENQMKRTNIIVDGISDEKDESWMKSEVKVRDILSSKLGLDDSEMEIERAHRIGQYQEGGKPRKVVVKLLRLKDKQTIMSSAKRLKGTNIFINEDFSEALQLRRRELLPKLRAARDRGERAFLKYDKLVILSRTGNTQT